MTSPVRKQLTQNLFCGGIALIAFIATSAAIHSLLPPVIPKGVAAKLKFFTEHKNEFDTVIVGTSRLYYSASPEIFDATTRANGRATHSFNFGIDGMHPPENFYVLEQILKTKPRNLKWVVLELGDIQTKWDNILGTQRAVYWHDWPRTKLTLEKAFNPRGNANWLIKLTRLWLARSQFISNLGLFGKQFTNVGRATDFLPDAERERYADAASELGPHGDGYRWAGDAMSAARAVGFQQRLADEISDATQKYLDPATDLGYRNAAKKIRASGATPVFVVTPIIFQTSWRFRQSPPAPIIAFNDARKYPEFYDAKLRIDDGHLTRPAAEDFCRALAREFVSRTRQP
jgi:hypothetical protein